MSFLLNDCLQTLHHLYGLGMLTALPQQSNFCSSVCWHLLFKPQFPIRMWRVFLFAVIYRVGFAQKWARASSSVSPFHALPTSGNKIVNFWLGVFAARFDLWITFSCGTVLLPSKISSSCRSDYLYDTKLLFYSKVETA